MPLAAEKEIAFQARKEYPQSLKRGVIAGAGFDLKTIRRAAPRPFSNTVSLWGNLVSLSVDNEGNFLAGAVMGAPMAVMTLEELIRRGAREIIFLGLGGSLTPELDPGKVVCPRYGLSTEGTSAHYPAPLKPDPVLQGRLATLAPEAVLQGRLATLKPDPVLQGRLATLAPEADQGCIWSTDGIYRETVELVGRQRRLGAQVVDMETTALWAAAAFRCVSLATVIVISDRLENDLHITGFHLPQFRKGLNQAATMAWQALSGDQTS